MLVDRPVLDLQLRIAAPDLGDHLVATHHFPVGLTDHYEDVELDRREINLSSVDMNLESFLVYPD
jgi:hypothetical protein